MWEAWKLSKAYGVPPSELYCIRDELAAWCLNRAVWLFGSTVEADLRQVVDSAKNAGQAAQRQQRVLASYGIGKVQYRDPVAAGGASKEPQQQVVSSDMSGPVAL